MSNCNGENVIAPTINCFTRSSQSINRANCGCTPCNQPVIVNRGDVTNQILVPVLANIIQNCICLSKYEPAYPTNLIITTNLLKSPPAESNQTVPSGTICINSISYNYSCIGIPQLTLGEGSVSEPVIDTTIGSNQIVLTGTTPSCSCGGGNIGPIAPTLLYNDFSGVVTTSTCCCNQITQAYAQNKIIERNVSFSICNLTIEVIGTIGGQEFKGTVALADTTATPTNITAFTNPLALSALSFPTTINFAGIMCLPTRTRMSIRENFDNCLIIDCIRPNVASYTVASDPTTAADGGTDTSTFANFLASADLSLVISKTISAFVSQKLAVMTNSVSQVVCTDSNIVPSCPQGNVCESETPC